MKRIMRNCSRCVRGVMGGIRHLPQPVIARVHGPRPRPVCQLAAACDLVVAAREATFATPGVKIGLFCTTPMVPLVRAIPAKPALEMLLTGKPISAERAYQLGLVNRVVPAVELDSAVNEYVEAHSHIESDDRATRETSVLRTTFARRSDCLWLGHQRHDGQCHAAGCAGRDQRLPAEAAPRMARRITCASQAHGVAARGGFPLDGFLSICDKAALFRRRFSILRVPRPWGERNGARTRRFRLPRFSRHCLQAVRRCLRWTTPPS